MEENMEDFKDRLHTIRQEQNKLLKEYQTLIADYEASDIILENEVLRKSSRIIRLAAFTWKSEYDILSRKMESCALR